MQHILSGSPLSSKRQVLCPQCCPEQPIPADLQWAEPTRCLCKKERQARVVLPSGQNPDYGLLPRSLCSQEQEAIARASQDLQVVYFPTVAGLGNECHVKYNKRPSSPQRRGQRAKSTRRMAEESTVQWPCSPAQAVCLVTSTCMVLFKYP